MLFNRHLCIQSAQRDESPRKETSHGDKIRDNHMRRLIPEPPPAPQYEPLVFFFYPLSGSNMQSSFMPSALHHSHTDTGLICTVHTHTHATVLCVYLLYRYDSNRPSNTNWNRMKVFVECKVFSPPPPASHSTERTVHNVSLDRRL